ncbi:MAG: membrane protein insertase YidC, partial [Gemmatimonadetes bacterium]|nr:membrane protein insertase YidC [Gemmatimonadota bacterium]
NILFPPQRPPEEPAKAPAAAPAGAAAPALAPGTAAASFAARTVTVRSPLYRYDFTTRGGALTGAELLRFNSYVAPGQKVQLVPRGAQGVLAYRVAAGRDTLDLRSLEFRPSADRLELRAGGPPQHLTFTAAAPNGAQVQVRYTFRPDDYLVHVAGQVTGVPGGARLLTGLGTGLALHDDREHASERETQVAAWVDGDVERLPLSKVTGTDTVAGPVRWAGIKDRYFLIATVSGPQSLYERVMVRDLADERFPGPGKARVAPRAQVQTVLPLQPGGRFTYDAYLGPLEHDRLVAVGYGLDEVNPYGYRWLRPIVKPISAVVLWALRELHALGLSFGWVLIVFGIMVRVVTWPLNAKATRSQMKNMAVQPLMQARMKEIQARYADDPREQQKEMMKMYSELGVSPLSMMSGCLPLLIPMPVLITLFFVFQSAIEFRGTSWGWLPDLSLRDPFYLLPVFLIASMFAMQYVTTQMSGMEQNAQTKMMMYMMPLMMGGFFLFMPSGLNLYYASTNVASLPQQLLLARERRRATEAQKAATAAREKAEKASSRSASPARAKAPIKRKRRSP